MPEDVARRIVDDPGQSRLPGVERIVAVASAKGGVGKSSVAVNLAVSLAVSGRRVGYADVDIYGPSAPIMLGIDDRPRPAGNDLVRPLEAHGLRVISMGFFLDDSAPVLWRGPMAMSATRQFVRGVDWGELDYLVVDLPPGTGDVPLTLAQEIPLDGVVIITTPQDVALADVRRGIAMLAKLNVPVLGVVQNMSGFLCPNCGAVDPVFGSRRAEDTAELLGVRILAEIPIDPLLRSSADDGVPLVEKHPGHPVTDIFRGLAGKVESVLDSMSMTAGEVHPEKIEHDPEAGLVRISWTDGQCDEYRLSGLRGWCPCAGCQGHGNKVSFVEVSGVELSGIEPVGRYAVRFKWSDGHDTGMYSYSYLREIAGYPECRP